jgi:hypothetical protein
VLRFGLRGRVPARFRAVKAGASATSPTGVALAAEVLLARNLG